VDAVAEIEETLVLHWSNFGRIPGGALHEEEGIVWFETPVQRLPYNGVIRTRLPEGEDADRVVARVSERMRSRGTDLFWIETPNSAPADLGERLRRYGLEPVETLIGMLLDLEGERRDLGEEAAGVRVVEVLDDGQLEEFIGLTAAYWELDGGQREEMAEIPPPLPARLRLGASLPRLRRGTAGREGVPVDRGPGRRRFDLRDERAAGGTRSRGRLGPDPSSAAAGARRGLLPRRPALEPDGGRGLPPGRLQRRLPADRLRHRRPLGGRALRAIRVGRR
jgi:hypothetical protein